MCTSQLTSETGVFFLFYSPNSQLKAEIGVFFWQIKPKKLIKYANFGHKLRKLAFNLRMNITKVTSLSVRLSPLVHPRVDHHESEWTSSFQNCELVQFVQLKDSFNWTSSRTIDPSLVFIEQPSYFIAKHCSVGCSRSFISKSVLIYTKHYNLKLL